MILVHTSLYTLYCICICDVDDENLNDLSLYFNPGLYGIGVCDLGLCLT